ncbi:MAG TPA: HAD-IIIA family hydrolase [Actinomycetota bacterium]|nr:HAD-IIIA family hydrolase [Actinomycetota bacterium]
MRYEAVFFDAGETLVHPHPTFPDLFATILRREGFDVSAQTVHDRIHVVFDRFRQAAETNELWTTTPEKSKRFWHDVYHIFFRELGIPDTDELIGAVYGEFTDTANYALFEDVVPALQLLRSHGLRLGVISNFEEWLERLLDQLGVSVFFPVRVISGVEGLEKPDLRIFELALERAGASAARSVYVGDNPDLDLEPAAAVGMLPVLIDRRERFPQRDGCRITTLAELPTVLELSV